MAARPGRPLPSLAHPVLLSAPEAWGRPLPAFPEIWSGWRGFCLPHVHWVGFKRSLIEAPLHPLRRTQLAQPAVGAHPETAAGAGHRARSLVTVEGDFERAYAHEDIGHWSLSGSLMYQWRRLLVLQVWTEIDRLFGDGAGTSAEEPGGRSGAAASVVVPLSETHPRPGFRLGQLARRLMADHALVRPVEEALAVWVELSEAENRGWLLRNERERLEHAYKQQYERRLGIRGFSALYARFRNLADAMGVVAAVSMAFAALNTPAPRKALLAMIGRVEQAQAAGVPIADPEVVLDVFEREIAAEYRADALRSRISRAARGWSGDEVFVRFWRAQPVEPLYCSFDSERLRGYEGAWDFPLPWVWLESLRQQLTTGHGLRCPFWDGKHCCRFRPMLERVVKQTHHSGGASAAWHPSGCLTA